MKLRSQPSNQEKVGEEKEKEDKESDGDGPEPKRRRVNEQEFPEITLSEIACLNISLEEIENFAKSSEKAAELFASLEKENMTGLSTKTTMLPNVALTITLYYIVRSYNTLHPEDPVGLFDFGLTMSDKDDLEGRMFFNEEGNCRRFILPVYTDVREEDSRARQKHYALIYMDKADNGHVLYADSFRLFKLPEERIKNIAKLLGMPDVEVQRLDRERVQHQTVKNSCGVHLVANSFAFLEHGIQFPKIHVDSASLRLQIVKFMRGVNYVKQRYSIEFGVPVNWNKPKKLKIPKEFENKEMVEENVEAVAARDSE